MKSNYGVFETFRTYHGKIFEVKAHLRRLHSGAQILRIPIALSNQQFIQALTGQCRKKGETRLKLIITPDLIKIESSRLTSDYTIYTTGVAVKTDRVSRQLPQVKQIDRTQEDMAYQRASKQSYFDTLLLTRQQTISEASRANVFFVNNDIIYTPNDQILYGITRWVVLQLAKKRWRVRYRLPTLTDLYQADECFLTRSSTGIVPVVRINRTKIGDGKPGPVTKELMDLFDEYVEIESRRTLKKN